MVAPKLRKTDSSGYIIGEFVSRDVGAKSSRTSNLKSSLLHSSLQHQICHGDYPCFLGADNQFPAILLNYCCVILKVDSWEDN